jgi:hypothetical protein
MTHVTLKKIVLGPWQRTSVGLWERHDSFGQMRLTAFDTYSSNPEEFLSYVYEHWFPTKRFINNESLENAKDTADKYAIEHGYIIAPQRLIVML